MSHIISRSLFYEFPASCGNQGDGWYYANYVSRCSSSCVQLEVYNGSLQSFMMAMCKFRGDASSRIILW